MTEEKYLFIKHIATPIGTLVLLADEVGLCLAQFDNYSKLDQDCYFLEKTLQKKIIVCERHPHLEEAQQNFRDYFNGHLRKFTVPFHCVGTDFQQLVWQTLCTIPYAKTISYLEQAKQMDRPTAMRAVANANSKNRLSIVIPCHRVIGSDGHLTGYAGGIERKKWLLEHEKKQLQKKYS